ILAIVGSGTRVGAALLAAGTSLLGGAVDVSIANIGQTDAALAGAASPLATTLAGALALASIARRGRLSCSPVGGVLFAMRERPPAARGGAGGDAASKRAQVRVGHAAKAMARVLESRLLGAHRPLFVNIEPTHRCNLECSYCDKTGAHAPQMKTEDALRLIDE